MSLDLKQIKKHYANMHNVQLERIAKFEMASLNPEVKPIVIAEIEKRGLNENLLKGIEAQDKELSIAEIEVLKAKIEGLDCPQCQQSQEDLVGGLVRKVRSYGILTQTETRPMIACPSCVEEARHTQLVKNALLGWWGFPLGLYHTPKALLGHYQDNRKKEAISDVILTEFAKQYVGELMTNWEEEEELVKVLGHYNTAQY